MDRRFRMMMHCLPHRFSRKFDILNKVRTTNVHVDILYKRKAQKINSVNVGITDGSGSRTNSK